MYEMKKMIYMVMALASLSYTTQTMAQSPGLQKKVNAYFLQSLKAQQKALEKDGKAEFAKNTPLETKLQASDRRQGHSQLPEDGMDCLVRCQQEPAGRETH